MKGKLVPMILCLCLLALLIPAFSAPAEAYTNGHTQSEAVAWINAQAGQWVRNGQCVDLAYAYFDYLGNSSFISGNGNDYVWWTPPSGWTWQSSPVPGDIVAWDAGADMGNGWTAHSSFGHIGLVVAVNGGTITTLEQNAPEGSACIYYDRPAYLASRYIHPDFAAEGTKLDVNALLDGEAKGTLESFGTCDVYINGSLVADDVNDYFVAHPIGTTYEIKDIKAKSGYKYLCVSSGSLRGTIGSTQVNVVLSFSTQVDIQYMNASGAQFLTVATKTGEAYTLTAEYPKASGKYFCGWSTTQNASSFEFRPGERITPTGNMTLYPVYVTQAQAVSGSRVYIYNIADFTDTNYNITSGTTNLQVSYPTSTWSDWSGYSLDAITAGAAVEVRTAPLFRYYAYVCPYCGSHDPFKGTCDGNDYELTDANWNETWSTIPYSQSGYAQYPAASSKCYTYNLGDGNRWNFNTSDIYATEPGYTSDGATVIRTGYSSRTLTETTATKTLRVNYYVLTEKAPVEYTVSFAAGGGSGTMAAQTVAEGGSLTLPACAFTAPAGKQFKAWRIGGTEYAVGASCTVTANTTVTAVWEDSTPEPPVTGAAIVVGDAKVHTGKTVVVPITFTENPGIVSFRLSISYDADLLTLVSAAQGDFSETTFGPTTANPFTVSRNGSIYTDISGENTAVLLTFLASEDNIGDAVITVAYDPDDIFNYEMENVAFAVRSGTVTVTDRTPGDVDGNDVVNMKDLALFQRWLNGWDVTIDEFAADVNASGKADMKDLALLQRYLNGWDVTLQ